ncbi:MAG: hypothetical protein ACRYFS_18115 [Janthinobacterium lividum]
MDFFRARVKRGFLYLCLLLVFFLLLKVGLWFVADARAKLHHGLTAQATVTGKSIHYSRRYTERYLHYQYEIGKVVYTSERTANEDQYNATKIGSQFVVTYLRGSPRNITIDRVTNTRVLFLNIITIGFLVVVGLGLVAIIFTNETGVRSGVCIMREGFKTINLSQRTAGGLSESEE